MIALQEILSYAPTQHGEHGVDAVLHRLAEKHRRIHEVFINPPGASWAHFDVLQPQKNQIFRWDHVPRLPAKAKKPNLILQFNEDTKMNFLSIETKQRITDFDPKISELMTRFFTGSLEYVGLKDRPAWHFKKLGNSLWTFIPPEERENLRFWFKKYDKRLINFWTGFTFAFDPEYYQRNEGVNVGLLQGKLDELIAKNFDLDVAIGVGWVGKYHVPFVLRSYSDDFKVTRFATEFDDLLSPCFL